MKVGPRTFLETSNVWLGWSPYGAALKRPSHEIGM